MKEADSKARYGRVALVEERRHVPVFSRVSSRKLGLPLQ